MITYDHAWSVCNYCGQNDGVRASAEAMTAEDLNLASKAVGALPIVNRIVERLELDRMFDQFLPCGDKRLKLPPHVGLGVLLRNILVAREPLYGAGAWAARYEEAVLGLRTGGAQLLNDDRVGRCLDALFDCDRAALMTAVVVQAVRAFELGMSELHNDSTTITFTGEYKQANGHSHHGLPTHRITYGHNKDHRPDLKQLVYILTTTADGSVPVWCSVDHGNATDDRTHVATWEVLRRLNGRADFLYVADSKLCTKENLSHIAQEGGRFVTVLPQTRREDRWFRDWLQTNQVAWTELTRRTNARRHDGPDDVYKGFESTQRSVDGYRVVWIWSSQKEEVDRAARMDRIDRANNSLEELKARLLSPRSRIKTLKKLQAEAEAALADAGAERWVKVDIDVIEEHHFQQAKPGRPTATTPFVRHTKQKFDLRWQSSADNIQYDARTDGIFPLITNDETMSMADVLKAYKHQLERRHEQLKSAFQVMPVFLKSEPRIEALLFVYFLALLVEALIERELRRAMERDGVASLPLYPEGRPCSAPTTEQVFRLFDEQRCHTLYGPGQTVLKRFHDPMTPLHKAILRMLGLSAASYQAAGEGVRR